MDESLGTAEEEDVEVEEGDEWHGFGSQPEDEDGDEDENGPAESPQDTIPQPQASTSS